MSFKINPNITAGFWVRLAAFAVDNLLIMFIRLVVNLSVFGLFSLVSTPVFFSYRLIDIVYLIIAAAYFTFFTYRYEGTPGKRLFRLKVIDCSDKPGWLNILYRETVGRFLTGFFCLGYITMVFSPEHCTFSDMLCDTRVVYINVYSRNML